MRASAATNRTVLRAVTVFLVALLVYLSTLGHEFVWDDRSILMAHEGLDDWFQITETLTSNFFEESHQPGSFDYWRPLVVLSHMIEATLFGKQAWGYHLVNVVLHATASVLVFGLGLQWFETRGRIALVAGLLFAVHPVHVEVVAWVSGRSDLLLGLFISLALLADRRWGSTGQARWLIVSLVAFVCSLLSKEAAAVFPLLVAARGLLVSPGQTPIWRRFTVGIRAALPSLAVLGIYLWLRLAIVAVSPIPVESSLDARSVVFWTWWSAFWLYTRLLVWPSSLNILHQIEIPAAPWSLSVIAGLSAFAGLLWLCWRQANRETGVAFGISIWLIGLLPVTHLIVPLSSQGQTGFPVAERFLYLPSIGFCLAAGWLSGSRLPDWLSQFLAAAWEGIEPKTIERYCSVAVPLLVIVVGGARSWNRCLDWRDETTLFAATVEQVPDNGTAQLNYAAALGDKAERELDPEIQRQLIVEARQHFQRAIELVPENYRAHYGLGNLYRLSGDLTAAEACYWESLRLRPDLYPAILNLGALLAERGDLRGALALFQRAIELRPRAAKARVNLAHVLVMQGRREEAIAMYISAVKLNPELEEAREGLRRAQE